jgi:hypothetical protein
VYASHRIAARVTVAEFTAVDVAPALHPHAPSQTVARVCLSRCASQNPWRLVYCTDRHGYSLKTLYRKAKGRGALVLVAMDSGSCVCAGFFSRGLEESPRYSGSGESFVMKVHPEFKAYHWSHRNNFFYVANAEFIAFGGVFVTVCLRCALLHICSVFVFSRWVAHPCVYLFRF